jgi:hypothetical protein
LCERRRAGFARLSGWQPVGNWVASAANFPASLLLVGVTPTTSRESRRTVCVEKWPKAKPSVTPAYHRKAETIRRGGGSFLSSAPGRAGESADHSGAEMPHHAERRQLTVMFCDLVGSTALSARRSGDFSVCPFWGIDASTMLATARLRPFNRHNGRSSRKVRFPRY